MLQHLLVLPLLLPFVFCSTTKNDAGALVNLASLFKEKCDGLPFRSKFILDSTTCYVSIGSETDCSDVTLTYGKLKNGVSSNDRRKLKSVGITEEGNSKICAFKIQGDCDSGENFQDWCYTVVEKTALTFHEAAENCEKKGQTLAVLHNDGDVQRLLKAISDFKADLFWIGAGTVESQWKFHDNSETDFFRVKPREAFDSIELGLLLQSRSDNDSYSGYYRVSGVNKKFPFICSTPINSEYRKKQPANEFPRPQSTTTTTLKPTTRYPRIPNPKEWVTINGKQLIRSYNSYWVFHHYTTNPTFVPAGMAVEKSPGFVVPVERFAEIEETCPELIKVGIWQNQATSYIGNNPPPKYILSESFYCAPRQLYCGANFQLRRIDKITGGDIYYPSTDADAISYLSASDPVPESYRIVRGYYLETPCWIWQNYTDTYNTIVEAGGATLWTRSDVYSHWQWSYSLDPLEAPLQEIGTRRPGPGYVILEELYEAYFKEKCPELVPKVVWHGSNGGKEYNTWIGDVGEAPAQHLSQMVYNETRRFYCAPRKDYCGADYLLRRCDRIVGQSGFHPQSWYPDSDYWERVQTNWNRRQEVCYIWLLWR